jgi:hypothetical protein
MISDSKLLKAGAALRALAALILTALPSPAGAQSFDLVGTRAKGMAGAFVAVADDATATWWNPAGVSSTLIFDGVADFRQDQLIDRQQTPIVGLTPGLRNGAVGAAVATPALGFSYFRVRQTGVEPAKDEDGRDRQDRGTASLARSLLTQQFGVTLAQSVGDFVVVGATVRVVRGSVGTAPASSAAPGPGMDAAAEADGQARTTGDVDVGILARTGRVRLGFAARNLAAPTFHGADGRPWRVSRLARVGVAIVADADRAGRQVWTLAVDADLAEDVTPFGRRRQFAAGAERWLTHRIGIRGGLGASTSDGARPTASVGGSVAVSSGVFVEGQATAGSDRAAKGWGVSVHAQF